MMNEYQIYSMKLNNLSDVANKVEKLIPQLLSEKEYTKSDIATFKEMISIAGDRYDFIARELKSLEVPAKLQEEHDALIKDSEAYRVAIKIMRDSFNENESKINFSEYDQGEAIWLICNRNMGSTITTISRHLNNLS